MASYREVFGKTYLDKLNKNYLIDMLDQYKSVLNTSTVQYLTDLLKLKYSVISNYLNENNEILNHLDIYKYIAQYNIYHKTKEELENKQILFKDYFNPYVNGNNVLQAYLKDGILLDMSLPENDIIATINLYNVFSDRERQILELKYLNEQLACVKNKKEVKLPSVSSYITDNGEDKLIYSTSYGLDKNNVIQKQLEKDIIELNKQINLELNPEEKENLHIHNLQYSSLLNFYSLDEDKMEEVPTDSKLEKTLVYHKNGLKFIAKTTYIR